MIDPRAVWPAFRRKVRQRLDAGAAEYGNASATKPLPTTLDEIAEELADVCGWSAVAFARIRALRARAEILEHAAPSTPEPPTATGLPAFRLDADTAALLQHLSSGLRVSPADAVRFALLLLDRRIRRGT